MTMAFDHCIAFWISFLFVLHIANSNLLFNVLGIHKCKYIASIPDGRILIQVKNIHKLSHGLSSIWV